MNTLSECNLESAFIILKTSWSDFFENPWTSIMTLLILIYAVHGVTAPTKKSSESYIIDTKSGINIKGLW